jgi:hypothetical protein
MYFFFPTLKFTNLTYLDFYKLMLDGDISVCYKNKTPPHLNCQLQGPLFQPPKAQWVMCTPPA